MRAGDCVMLEIENESGEIVELMVFLRGSILYYKNRWIFGMRFLCFSLSLFLFHVFVCISHESFVLWILVFRLMRSDLDVLIIVFVHMS